MAINKVGIFVSLFVMLIIGIVLLGTTADTTYLATEAGGYTITNESIILLDNSAIDLANNWVTSITTLALPNGTAVTNYTSARLNSDDVAQITYLSEAVTNFTGNTTYVSYAYQDDNYVRDSTSRVFIRLILVFFGIAILLMAIWGMYQMGIGDILKK